MLNRKGKVTESCRLEGRCRGQLVQLYSEQVQLDHVTQALPSQILDISKGGESVSTGVHIYSILSVGCKKGFSANFRQGVMKH